MTFFFLADGLESARPALKLMTLLNADLKSDCKH